ncbi:MAG: hypothetical protein ACXV2E_06020 [Halobacteriota archaeon]
MIFSLAVLKYAIAFYLFMTSCARVVATLVVVVFVAHWAETVPVAASAIKAFI